MNDFSLLKQEGWARRGRLKLPHGTIETPVFMPVGTVGTVKAMSPRELRESGTQILLGNTYHLYLRPGLETLKRFGGLHSFMNWDGPILTDSGGFQVFSLGKLRSINDEGVVFQSHLNGDKIFLTPELSAEIQQVIGSDIAMAFDECVALPASDEQIRTALNRSILWAKRFLNCPRPTPQKVFGIIQGGHVAALRKESLEKTLALEWDGIAVGGLSVGEPRSVMLEVLEGLSAGLPSQLPHYLMGVGSPLDILESVRLGIDMFDCVLPTRNGRNGGFFTDDGLLNIRNHQYKEDKSPIQDGCECECCQQFSRAYLRHLFQAKEILGCRLATLHNLHYYHAFMQRVRSELENGTFESWYRITRERLSAGYPEREMPNWKEGVEE